MADILLVLMANHYKIILFLCPDSPDLFDLACWFEEMLEEYFKEGHDHFHVHKL